MLSGLREEVQRVLYAVPAGRKPALRRSDDADQLFATDLPCVAEREEVQAFLARMEERGWRGEIRHGWISLDAPVPVPVAPVPGKLTGECGCCISILLRHRDEDAPAEALIREVVKAADAGLQPFERACAWLHGTLAQLLRARRPLPGALLPYLCCAHEAFYK